MSVTVYDYVEPEVERWPVHRVGQSPLRDTNGVLAPGCYRAMPLPTLDEQEEA